MGGGTTTRGGSANRSEEDQTEKLISKVCASFLKKIEEKFDTKIGALESKLNRLCDAIKKMEDSVTYNKKEIDNVKTRLDDMEQATKRNSLRICGFREVANEDLAVDLSTFLQDNLGVSCSTGDFNYVFRLPKGNDDHPSPIIAGFISNIKRNQIFMQKKKLKNHPVSLFEDLTPRRYQLLLDAKRKYGHNNVWSISGKIFRWNPATSQKMCINKIEDIK